jgi:hypothetical protein
LSALKIIAKKYEKTRYERQKMQLTTKREISDSEKLIPFLLRLASFSIATRTQGSFFKKVSSENNSPSFFQ